LGTTMTSSANGMGNRVVAPWLWMMGLGLTSGILSATIGYDLELPWLKPVAPIFFLDVGPMPIGFFFGAAVAFGLWMWSGHLWAVPVILVTTMYAWSAAIQLAIRIQRNAGDDPHLIAASLAAGFVGAALTHVGCALFARELRRPARIGLTAFVGASAGLLFYAGERQLIDSRLLFVVWQPLVAACIGAGLGRTDRGA
jgi:hypothetical protein